MRAPAATASRMHAGVAAVCPSAATIPAAVSRSMNGSAPVNLHVAERRRDPPRVEVGGARRRGRLLDGAQHAAVAVDLDRAAGAVMVGTDAHERSPVG